MVEETQDAQSVISQPAGHLEEGESLLEAVTREVHEETAWHFDPDALVGIYRWEYVERGLTFLRFCYTGRAHSHNPELALDTGILGTHWLTYEELLSSQLRSPIVLRCVDDYIAGQRYPLSICTDLVAHEPHS